MEEDRNLETIEQEKTEEKGVTKEWATPLKANRKGENSVNSINPFSEEQTVREEHFGENKISFLEAIGGIFFQPITTLRQVGQQGHFLWGIAITLLVFLIDAILGATFVQQEFLAPFGMFDSTASIALFNLAFFPLGIGFSFAYGGILYAAGSLLGGNGRFHGFYAAIALAALPSVIIAFLQPLLADGALNLLFVLLRVAILIWVIVLQVFAIRECLLLTTGKAVLIYFLPLLFLLGSIIWMLALGMYVFPGWGEFFY